MREGVLEQSRASCPAPSSLSDALSASDDDGGGDDDAPAAAAAAVASAVADDDEGNGRCSGRSAPTAVAPPPPPSSVAGAAAAVVEATAAPSLLAAAFGGFSNAFGGFSNISAIVACCAAGASNRLIALSAAAFRFDASQRASAVAPLPATIGAGSPGSTLRRRDTHIFTPAAH